MDKFLKYVLKNYRVIYKRDTFFMKLKYEVVKNVCYDDAGIQVKRTDEFQSSMWVTERNAILSDSRTHSILPAFVMFISVDMLLDGVCCCVLSFLDYYIAKSLRKFNYDYVNKMAKNWHVHSKM